MSSNDALHTLNPENDKIQKIISKMKVIEFDFFEESKFWISIVKPALLECTKKDGNSKRQMILKVFNLMETLHGTAKNTVRYFKEKRGRESIKTTTEIDYIANSYRKYGNEHGDLHVLKRTIQMTVQFTKMFLLTKSSYQRIINDLQKIKIYSDVMSNIFMKKKGNITWKSYYMLPLERIMKLKIHSEDLCSFVTKNMSYYKYANIILTTVNECVKKLEDVERKMKSENDFEVTNMILKFFADESRDKNIVMKNVIKNNVVKKILMNFACFVLCPYKNLLETEAYNVFVYNNIAVFIPASDILLIKSRKKVKGIKKILSKKKVSKNNTFYILFDHVYAKSFMKFGNKYFLTLNVFQFVPFKVFLLSKRRCSKDGVDNKYVKELANLLEPYIYKNNVKKGEKMGVLDEKRKKEILQNSPWKSDYVALTCINSFNEKVISKYYKNFKISISSDQLISYKGISMEKTNQTLFIKPINDTKDVFYDLHLNINYKIYKGDVIFSITPLDIAIMNNDYNGVKKLLKNITNDMRIRCERTFISPLTRSCYVGNIEICKLLLKCKHINLNGGENFISPLYAACSQNHYEIVKLLLNKKGLNFSIGAVRVDSYPVSCLYGASMSNNFNIVKLILSKKKVRSIINEGRENPLFAAAICGNEEVAKLLIKNGADHQKGKSNVVLGACIGGNVNMLKFLINNSDLKGVSLTKGHPSPLYYSCEHGKIECIKELLKNKSVNSKFYNGYESPLIGCCIGGNVNTLKLLKEKNIFDINSGLSRLSFYKKKYDLEKSPLHFACESVSYNVDFIKEMLKCEGINVNFGRLTALYESCKLQRVDIVQELMKCTSINVNKGDITPLYITCKMGNVKLLKILLANKNIDINLKSVIGEDQMISPLQIATRSLHFDIVKELLKRKDLIFKKELIECFCYEKKMYNTKRFPVNVEEEIACLFLGRKWGKDISVDSLLKNPKINMRIKKNILERYVTNKTSLRKEIWSLSNGKYSLGIDIREFYKIALIIGMKNYTNDLSPLNTSHNDAREIKKVLEDQGFDSSIKEDLTGDDLNDEFDVFCSELTTKSKMPENIGKTMLVLIFFSGHGISQNSNSYLLPIDFEEKFCMNSSKLNSNSLSTLKIQNNLTLCCKNSVNVIVLDACRSNVNENAISNIKMSLDVSQKSKEIENTIKELNPRMKTRGLSSSGMPNNFKSLIKSGDNFVYAFASDPNAPALDSVLNTKFIESDIKHSPFSLALINCLQEKGNLEQIFINVRNLTKEYSNSNQNPWVNTSLSYSVVWEKGQNIECEYFNGSLMESNDNRNGKVVSRDYKKEELEKLKKEDLIEIILKENKLLDINKEGLMNIILRKK